MNRGYQKLANVIDEVVAEANAAAKRRDDESRAIKTAAAEPRTELGRGLRALADSVRGFEDDVSYDDFRGIL